MTRTKMIAGMLVNLLMLAYLAMGVAVVLYHSIPWGILYVGVIGLSFVVVAYARCTKCPCRFGSCTHIWLGRFAQMLPSRDSGPYTTWDKIGETVYLAGLQLFPQYWLWQHKALFVLFWVLSLATFLVGPLYTCKACENTYCELNRSAYRKE